MISRSANWVEHTASTSSTTIPVSSWLDTNSLSTASTVVVPIQAYQTQPISWTSTNASVTTDILWTPTVETIAVTSWVVSNSATSSATTYTITNSNLLYVPAELTEADRARIQMEREAKDTARARAEALLSRHLREDQRKTLREHGWIQVTAKSSGNRYRIYRGRSHNVRLLDAHDREVASLCAHPTMVVPEADCMLSQMLMLELTEDRFLAMANRKDLLVKAATPTNRRAA